MLTNVQKNYAVSDYISNLYLYLQLSTKQILIDV